MKPPKSDENEEFTDSLMVQISLTHYSKKHISVYWGVE